MSNQASEPIQEHLTDHPSSIATGTVENIHAASPYAVRSTRDRGPTGLAVSGWLTTGFTWNPLNPANDLNRPVLLNDQANEFALDQLYGILEWESSEWYVKTQIDFLLGNDARFITVPGLEKHQDGSDKWSSDQHEVQLAIPQAYVLIDNIGQLPIEIKMGHFLAPESYESFSSLSNVFYSRSYEFNFATPFTYSGILSKFRFSELLEVHAGVTAGWDNWQSGKGLWSTLIGVKRTNHDRSRTASMYASLGIDATNVIYQGGHDSDRRLSIRASIEQRIHRHLHYVFNVVYGEQDESLVRVDVPNYRIEFDKANWYGLSQYLIWKPSPQTTAGLRMEWFRDADQSRIAVPVDYLPFGPVFTGGNYFAISGVVSRWINHATRIRTEVRWDISDFKGNGNVPAGNPDIRAFGDRHSADQWLLIGDITLRF